MDDAHLKEYTTVSNQTDARAGVTESYIRDLFIPDDPTVSGFEQEMEDAGLPRIQVPAELGKLLGVLVQATAARRILEIGTLGGYSAMWMARALPEDGRIVSLELEPRHAEFARGFLERAGVVHKVEIVVGPALETLPSLMERDAHEFDLVFIDADKEGYPAYLDWAMRLVRPGGLIVADNVLRGGKVAEPGDDPAMRAVDEFNRHIAASPLLDATILPNRSGGDGVLIAVVREHSQA